MNLNNIKQAIELAELNQKCPRKHDYSKSGYCMICHEIWTTKEQIDIIKTHKDWC